MNARLFNFLKLKQIIKMRHTMTAQTTPSNVFTFEQLMELFRDTDRRMKETDRQMKETDRQMKETDRQMKETGLKIKETDRILQESIQEMRASNKRTDKKLAEFGDRLGEIIEVIVEGGIVRKFRELGYSFSGCSRRYEFENKQLAISGEIDLFLEDGDDALAAEIKTKLTISDIKEHIKRMERFRKYADARNDKRRFLAAVGGGVVCKEVQDYAMKNGIYVIIQSGESVEIAPLPKGFKARVW
jgi:hypothetical protein